MSGGRLAGAAALLSDPERGDRVAVGGLSMGVTAAAWRGQRRGAKNAAVIRRVGERELRNDFIDTDQPRQRIGSELYIRRTMV